MAKPWDASLKQLVRANPRAFVTWLVPGAEFVAERPCELKPWQLEVDVLLQADFQGHSMPVGIEFQTYHDATMPERLLRYNVLTHGEYQLPVASFVIYLLKDGTPETLTSTGRQEIASIGYTLASLAFKYSRTLLISNGSSGDFTICTISYARRPSIRKS